MKTRDKSLIAVFVLIIIAAVGYVLVVQPRHHQASRLQTQIASSQNALGLAEAQVHAGLTAESQYKTYVGELKVSRRAVPSDVQIPELINELQAASTKNRVVFQSVAVASSSSSSATSTVATASSFPSQSFTLSFTGNYFAVASLLGTVSNFVHADDKRFQATGRLINISSVALSSGSSGTSGSGDVTANLTALDYDVPTALISGTSSTSTSTSTSTATGTPAADVSP